MKTPQLYKAYDRDQAIALFGDAAQARSLCGGQWVLLPDAIVGLTDVGQPPEASHFGPASWFHWVADRPYKAAPGDPFASVPREVRAGREDARPLHLFVRAEEAACFLYIGTLRPAQSWGRLTGQACASATFDLSPVLPSRIWRRLGGPAGGGGEVVALDRSLHGLGRHRAVAYRLTALRQLVQYWHDPIRPSEGYTETELQGKPIPGPLRWWYRWAGRRKEIVSGQNVLQGPDELKADADGRVAFYFENQCCYQWAASLVGEDPPVLGRSDKSEPWTAEGMTLSEFLVEACLSEAVYSAPYGAATAWVGGDELAAITARIPALPLAPWRWPGSTVFHAGGGALMLTIPNGEYNGQPGSSVWIGAKTEKPLSFLKDIVQGRNWDYVSL